MPSSKSYVRNYQQEYATDSKERRKQRVKRNQARATMVKAGAVKKGDGKHVDHKQPLSKGGSTNRSNLRVQTARKNTSYARKSSGAIK